MSTSTDHQPPTPQVSPAPEESDHGAWDGPTVTSAQDDAVRGGLTSVARGVGTGLGLGVHVLRKAGTALGAGLGHGRPHHRR